MATRIIRTIVVFICLLSPLTVLGAHDEWVYQGVQVELARVQLEAIRTKLRMYGVGQKMGFGKQLGGDALAHEHNPFWYYGFSVRNLAFNTFNFGRLLFTDEESRFLTEWRTQYTDLEHTLAALKVVYDIMGERGVTLQNAFAIADSEPQYSIVRNWTDSLTQSLWAEDVMTDRALPMRPALPSDFGLNFKTDFVNEDWKTLLAKQLNIVNTYVFWRGSAMLAAFGKSPLGLEVARVLRLNRIANAVKTLPASLQGPTLWMIYETADGCTVRYFQIAYVGLRQLGQTDVVGVTTQIKR